MSFQPLASGGFAKLGMQRSQFWNRTLDLRNAQPTLVLSRTTLVGEKVAS
jgi:hypothetical protein